MPQMCMYGRNRFIDYARTKGHKPCGMLAKYKLTYLNQGPEYYCKKHRRFGQPAANGGTLVKAGDTSKITKWK